MQVKIRYEPATQEVEIDGPEEPILFFGLLGMAFTLKLDAMFEAKHQAVEDLAQRPPGLELVKSMPATPEVLAEIRRKARGEGQ